MKKDTKKELRTLKTEQLKLKLTELKKERFRLEFFLRMGLDKRHTYGMFSGSHATPNSKSVGNLKNIKHEIAFIESEIKKR